MKKSFLLSIHIIFWLLFIWNGLQKSSSIFEYFQKPLNWSAFLINFSTFYFNYFFVIPKLLKQKKLVYFVLGLISVFLFFTSLRYLVEEILFPIFLGFRNYFEGTSLMFYFYDNLFWGSNAVFMSSLIWFLNYSFKIDKEKQQLLEQKNEAEMSLLKSQINPHFIFNTLNNIYSLVNQKSNKSLDAIEKLGDLLRFSSNEIKKDFTSLNDEIQYVKNFIDLEKLRITNPENIIFEDKTLDKNLKIAPMILIPFVENAFKHGNLKDFPLNILIETQGNQLHFYQKNRISNQEKDKSSGIGIENVKKRLSIIYPDKHSLKIVNENGFYEVDLKVELNQ